jgi:hypothetical protein
MTIFLSAFLLFQVQPLIGKVILPWFGGTPAVWMTCLLFFQVLLLGGYLYAHLLVDGLPVRWQGRVHLAVLLGSLALLPIAPDPSWKPAPGDNPLLSILGLLLVTVGGPFLVLSTTGPLLQAWFVRRHPGRSPYRLYALSNVGSLLALLSYPFVFEPALRVPLQLSLWSWAHVAFVVLCGSWALRMALWPAAASTEAVAPTAPAAAPAASTTATATDERPGALQIAIWLLLSTFASAMLLATTNQITQNVAPAPFLWVLPLSLYLLSFILCFDAARWYRRGLFGWVLAACLFAVPIYLLLGPKAGLLSQVGIYTFALFACCMGCNGELAASKPSPRHLTAFYLLIALGGALGGLFVSVVAPAVFDSLAEYPIALGGCCVAFVLAKRRDALRAALHRRFAGRPGKLAVTAAGLVLLACAALPGASMAWNAYLRNRDVLEYSRNFYGTLQVGQEELDVPERGRRTLTHGNTVHGIQFQEPALRGSPGGYYGPRSGIACGFAALREARGRPLRVGIVGMGTGALAAYTQAGDSLRFYEINPDVVSLARRWFTYWDDAVARGVALEVCLGDARLVLEAELAGGAGREGGPEPLDLLVVDAFSSDAIPVHLLTAECFDLYRQRLAPDGLIAAHVSNQYLYLAPVVRQQAERLGLTPLRVHSAAVPEKVWFDNDWVLATADPAVVERVRASGVEFQDWPPVGEVRLWTDDYSSLFPLLK